MMERERVGDSKEEKRKIRKIARATLVRGNYATGFADNWNGVPTRW